jgi:SAM-dependent MidA family methyltransferase
VLARQLLDSLGARVGRYTIVDLSGALRDRQREVLHLHLDRVRWVDALPETMQGVIVGNEVLDAMPVQLLHFDGQRWLERGVAVGDAREATDDRPSGSSRGSGPTAKPRCGRRSTKRYGLRAGTVTEIHPQAEAFIATLGDRLERGAAFFIDYGFPATEYYHPQRSGGTLMCHRAHRADAEPLADVAAKDITAHVNFTGIAIAGQAAGLDVLGYTSQARFLMNCGLLDLLEGADIHHSQRAETADRARDGRTVQGHRLRQAVRSRLHHFTDRIRSWRSHTHAVKGAMAMPLAAKGWGSCASAGSQRDSLADRDHPDPDDLRWTAPLAKGSAG